jgi:hypothetical protein
MLNAVERLWRGLAERDAEAVRAQLHSHATIEFPHLGEVFTAAQYAALSRTQPPDWKVVVHAVVAASEDLPVAVHASVSRGDDHYRCGGFYVLQQARIAHGVELWVPERGTLPPVDPPGRLHRH